jgi:hypothetical protein
MDVITDIPKFYTALAEWCSCLALVLVLPKRHSKGMTAGMLAAGFFLLCVMQYIIGIVPLFLWLPGMAVALLIMYLLIYLPCAVTGGEAEFLLMLVFMVAEYMASLEWQCEYFLQNQNSMLPATVISMLCLVVFMGGNTLLFWFLEQHATKDVVKVQLTLADMIAVALIALGAFAISNISYVNQNNPFSGTMPTEIFYIRTLVDLAGMIILLSFQNRCRQLALLREYNAIHSALDKQYELYRQTKSNMEIVHRQYHDLKHQIGIIRLEEDAGKRETYLQELEDGLRGFAGIYHTGNKVVDIILSGKQNFCQQKKITLVVVADAEKLDFISDMDLASMLGNALDNAIESVSKLKDEDKRLVKFECFVKNQFVMIKTENYFEGHLQRTEGHILTTKKNKDFHGYGIKSIQYVAEKYHGTATISTEEQWFCLQILIPLP